MNVKLYHLLDKQPIALVISAHDDLAMMLPKISRTSLRDHFRYIYICCSISYNPCSVPTSPITTNLFSALIFALPPYLSTVDRQCSTHPSLVLLSLCTMTSDTKESMIFRSVEHIDSPPAYQETTEQDINGDISNCRNDSLPQFPNQWNIHGKKANMVNFTNWQYTISSHKNDSPLFSMIWRSLHLTFHSGPDLSSSKACAEIRETSPSNNVCTLNLLAEDHVHSSIVMCSRNFSLLIERLNEKAVLETFEWRRSSGSEVQSIEENASGWKLVRSDPETIINNSKTVEEMTEEVVAAWATPISMSWTHVGTFRYFGAGATGELEDEWRVLAALSAMRIYQAEVMGWPEL